MKKTIILLSILMLVSIIFSGCTDVNIPDDLTKKMAIVTFTVTPSIIELGDTANLSWVVTGSDTSVNIDNGIGEVSLTGNRIISSTETTTYKLTATNGTSTKDVTTQIIVILNSSEENNSESTPDIAFNKEVSPTKGLRVVRADIGIKWSDLHIVGGTKPSDTTVDAKHSVNTVGAGQFIALNTTSSNIIIVYTPTNTLMGTWTWVDSSSNRIAVIDTTMGTIKVQLYEDKMPITTANFVKLANDGFYNGLVFHRVIDNFMIQTGGFLPDGTPKSSPYGNIKFETSDLKHVDGAISMASTGAKVGGSAQFFICDGAQSNLDGNYAAFGKVIEGMDVVREISSVQTTTKFTSYSDWPVNDVIINSITIVSS